jgi:hypothetical protein
MYDTYNIDNLCTFYRNEQAMPAIHSGTFERPSAHELSEGLTAHFYYKIRLSKSPEEMVCCNAHEGFYANQIGFMRMVDKGDVGTAVTLVVRIYCGVNLSYDTALKSLFGTEVGQILCLTGNIVEKPVEDYLCADVQDPAGYPGIVEQLLRPRQSNELAMQVYGRLMVNSIFL